MAEVDQHLWDRYLSDGHNLRLKLQKVEIFLQISKGLHYEWIFGPSDRLELFLLESIKIWDSLSFDGPATKTNY
jgi:hypothetical protein